MNPLDRTIRRIDGVQQRHRWLAFPFAVVKKFGENRGGNLAALITYYGFLSLFPLLLVLVAVLGLLLRGHDDLQRSILDSTLADFPVIGEQLRSNIRGLSGGGAGVAVGIGTVTALWAGLGVVNAAQNAFNDVWDVPLKDRPNFVETRLRGFLMLVVLGAMTLSATFVSGLGTGEGRSFWFGALAVVATLVLNLLLYMIAFRVLTDLDLSWGDVIFGAVVGGVLWTALQSLGSYYIQHQIKNATEVYGTFALVLGLLGWIYLGAQITLLAASVNVVRKHALWPRSLVQQPPLAPADKKAMRRAAKAEERIEEENVSVGFEPMRSAPPPEGAKGAKEIAGRATTNQRRMSPPRPGPESKDAFLPSVGVGAAAVVLGVVLSRIRRSIRHRA